MLRKFLLVHLFSTATRNPYYKTLDKADLAYFESQLSPKQIITENIQGFNIDYTKKYQGASQLALTPTTVKSLQLILKYCNENRLAVVPQGGNTGLVGGNVPLFDEIIVSLRKLNQIEGFDKFSSIISCEAGCILENLNQHLSQYEYEIPLDLGAKGSCHIGGNVSTHAGGKYFIKYGPLRGNILGIQAVLANGEILDMRSKLRKDNTGIDLKQLFIGAEGALGIITKLDIQCVKVDKLKVVVLVRTDSYKQVLQLAETAKKVLGKSLNSLQYMDGYAYNLVFKHLKYNCPLPAQINQHTLLMEVNGQALDQLTFIPEQNQSIMSNNDSEYNGIWKIRQSIAQAANRQGLCLKYDVSFDVTKWDSFMKTVRQKLTELKAYSMGYGHIGDGNLHINICIRKDQAFDERFIIDQVIKHKGSISAEHGIGQHKAQYLRLQKQQEVVDLGKEIKKIFDPNLILNPYKLYSN